jgi:predicted aspartyl protease
MPSSRLKTIATVFALYCAASLVAASPIVLAQVEIPPQDEIPPQSVPYRVGDAGHLYVDAHVNGAGPYSFLIDTASTVSAFTVRDAVDGEAAKKSNAWAIIHGVADYTAHSVVELRSLRVGGVEARGINVVTLPITDSGREWIGILGMDFFAGHVAIFRSGPQMLSLVQKARVPSGAFTGWRRLRAYRDSKLQDNLKLLFVNVRIDDTYIEGVLDLGSSVNIINWAGAKAIGYEHTHEKLERSWAIAGANGAFQPKAIIRKQKMSIGQTQWTAPLLIADTPPLKPLGREDKPFVILNAAFFGGRDFAIDFEKPEVYLLKD